MPEIRVCDRAKAIANCIKHKKLINFLDGVWDEYAKTKKTRHGRDYKV